MPILEKAAEKIVDAAVNGFIGCFRSLFSAHPESRERSSRSLRDHLREVNRWSADMLFLGLPSGDHEHTDSIALKYHGTPRRYRSRVESSDVRTESDFLTNDRNYLLIGDPGSGKTTSMKRLARRLLTSAPLSAHDVYQFPVLLRLRSLAKGESLFTALGTILGLCPTEAIVPRVTWKSRESRVTRQKVLMIGDEIMRDAIARSLSVSHSVILLDGLDEVPPEDRNRVEAEIEVLAARLDGAKIILTCRSGDYAKPLEGFSLFDILPLDAGQIKAIAKLWLTKPTNFLKKLASLPYRDVVDRPLLLCQLLFIYKHYEYLPEQPSQVYKRIIRLLLDKWDSTRNVKRLSRYAGFETERKEDFLAELSYHLTYKVKAKEFTEADLIKAYRSICKSFGLPKDEATRVAQELESHSGILMETGLDLYGFSHLSIQEYLCANHIVRGTYGENFVHYLTEYPAPIAVAVALSSAASSWFSYIILRPHLYRSINARNIKVLLSRILIEHPYFTATAELGRAAFRIHADFARNHEEQLPEFVAAFIAYANVSESMAICLEDDILIVHDAKDADLLFEIRNSNFWSARNDKGLLVEMDKVALERIVERAPNPIDVARKLKLTLRTTS